MTGHIKTLNIEKGFGFIKPSVGSHDFFFHRSGVKNAKFEELQVGMEVTFEDTEGEKGPRAEDVYV